MPVECRGLFKFFHKNVRRPDGTFNLTYNCGQPFTIERFTNVRGSPCHTCQKSANTQYAIIDGRGEPQGSLYYCISCDPKDISTVKSHYLLVMGYSD